MEFQRLVSDSPTPFVRYSTLQARGNAAADRSVHAHPSLKHAKTATPNADDPWDLVQRMTLEVTLQGLLGDERPSPASMFLPRVRRSPLSRDNVQHLDIVSCWKGISPSQGNELAAWEGVFEECLASHLSKHLQEGCVKWLNQYIDPSNEALLVSRFQKYLEFSQTSPAEISITSLVEDMVAHVYEQPHSHDLHLPFPWTLSSGHMPSLVYNFVSTRDCFLHTTASSKVFFKLEYQYYYGVMHIKLKLLWSSPKIEFPSLRTAIHCGETYIVAPQLDETSLGTTKLGVFDVYRNDISFSISSSAVPLRWHSGDNCFHTVVRQRDEDATEVVVKSVLTATISTQFHDGVRFERISRYVIRANVYAHTKPVTSPQDYAGTPDTQIRFAAGHKRSNVTSSQLLTATQLSSCTARLPHHESDSAWVPSYSTTPVSKTGRRDSMQPLQDELDFLKTGIATASTSLSNIESVDESDQLVQECVSLGMRLEELRHRALEKHDASLMGIGVPSLRGARKASQSANLALQDQGRFALDKLEHLNLEVDAKRRKLSQLDYQDDMVASKDDQGPSVLDGSDDGLHAALTNITTGPMGEAQTSPIDADGGFWSAKLDRYSLPSAPRAHAATLPGIKHTIFPWKDRHVKCSAYPPSEGSSSHVHEITPPGSASSEHPPTLQSKSVPTQKQIQHNYQEFEERAKQKAAEKAYYAATVPGFDGIVSPTDENDKSFERIFLEDGETND
ncbi:hypothetical protein BKA63DRAFT_419420 [Paraphoma chrysanthemicola]|nr:hypothetical protein BKA63DRAFT_419420 [Paraphoma chrysanthemicola]